MNTPSSRERIEAALPIFLLVGLIVLAVNILSPFAPAIIWAIILAVAFRPLHRRLSRKLGDRSGLAATALGILLCTTLVLPIVFLSRSIIAFIPEAIAWASEAGLAASISDGELSLDDYLPGGDRMPVWPQLVADVQYILNHFGDELRPVAFWLIGEGRLLGLFAIEFALGVLLAVILLYRSEHSDRLVTAISERLGGAFARDLAKGAVAAIRSTVFGVLGSAAAQTAVATIAYVIVGVPHWPVVALATFILGLVQVGPILIWLPICLWLWTNGQIGMAVFMLVWGLLAVGLTDNLVKAITVSRGTGLPAMLAFLGAVGGLLTWGIVGLFIGPVVIAVALQVLQQWLAWVPPEPSNQGDSS